MDRYFTGSGGEVHRTLHTHASQVASWCRCEDDSLRSMLDRIQFQIATLFFIIFIMETFLTFFKNLKCLYIRIITHHRDLTKYLEFYKFEVNINVFLARPRAYVITMSVCLSVCV